MYKYLKFNLLILIVLIITPNECRIFYIQILKLDRCFFNNMIWHISIERIKQHVINFVYYPRTATRDFYNREILLRCDVLHYGM